MGEWMRQISSRLTLPGIVNCETEMMHICIGGRDGKHRLFDLDIAGTSRFDIRKADVLSPFLTPVFACLSKIKLPLRSR